MTKRRSTRIYFSEIAVIILLSTVSAADTLAHPNATQKYTRSIGKVETLCESNQFSKRQRRRECNKEKSFRSQCQRQPNDTKL